MIAEKVLYSDFDRISKENEYYIWHFLRRNQDILALRSVFDKETSELNPINILLRDIEIPYFESYVEDSIDFLDRIGINPKLIWNKGDFNPVIVGFKRKRMVNNTYNLCYGTQGLTDLIGGLNLEFLIKN